VNRWWSVLFGVVMLGCLGMFVAAPFVGWWMPKNISSFGPDVDNLFYLILAITGFFFILTEAILIYFMWVYAGPRRRPDVFGHHYAEKKVFWTSFFKSIARPVSAILHNQHRVELAWTLVPGIILLYIALAQINTWAGIKDPSNMPEKPDVTMVVSARMFEWRVRYPDPDTPPSAKGLAQWSASAQADDVHVVNEIHTWQGANVKLFLKTQDVIHSFYLPNLRLKQDALPGKIIPVWFRVTDPGDPDRPVYNTIPVDGAGKPAGAGTNRRAYRWVDGYDPETKELDHTEQVWELACAELCGWGHYKMRGKLFVHKNRADYLAWLRAAQRSQFTTRAEDESSASTGR
jgi:cytochrome c oxidase subunit 2